MRNMTLLPSSPLGPCRGAFEIVAGRLMKNVVTVSSTDVAIVSVTSIVWGTGYSPALLTTWTRSTYSKASTNRQPL